MRDASPIAFPSELEACLGRLLNYCRHNDWAGFDPYDALNSRLFAATPLSRSRVCRIAATQTLKRLPINLRPLLGISKEQNPKGLALGLSALLSLRKAGIVGDERPLEDLLERLIALRSPGTTAWCWGYSFPWQTRTVLVPKDAPNLVCTSFVANALLDLDESGLDSRCLGMAASAADYILRDLYWTAGEVVGFSYPTPTVRVQVHNANFLAAALLCRVYSRTGNVHLLEPALKAARYSASAQNADGSWSYSESATQGWIDNFHTGYNLCALRDIGRFANTAEFESHVSAGFNFYRAHFFAPTGAPKYFHNRTYPIDAHCAAQSVITLLALRDLADDNVALATSVLRWCLEHMWDERGFFYYQVWKLGRNRISYMRWTQAWMLLALATFVRSASSSAPQVNPLPAVRAGSRKDGGRVHD